MFLAPNGKVFNSGPTTTTRYLDTAGSGAWTLLGDRVGPYRDYGSAVMYAPGKILVTGGGQPPTNTAEVIDLNQAHTELDRRPGRWPICPASSQCHTVARWQSARYRWHQRGGWNNPMILWARSMPQSSGIRRPKSGQRSPAARHPSHLPL